MKCMLTDVMQSLHRVCQVEYEYSTGKYAPPIGRVTDAEGVHLMQQGTGAPTLGEDSLPVFTLEYEGGTPCPRPADHVGYWQETPPR